MSWRAEDERKLLDEFMAWLIEHGYSAVAMREAIDLFMKSRTVT